ncbi:hypothetical protein Tco_1075752 [Tanacetum coccineum]
MGVFKTEQLKEISIGLEKRGKRFLWVVREPPSDDVNELPHSGSKDFSLDAVLAEGFLAQTSDKGLAEVLREIDGRRGRQSVEGKGYRNEFKGKGCG